MRSYCKTYDTLHEYKHATRVIIRNINAYINTNVNTRITLITSSVFVFRTVLLPAARSLSRHLRRHAQKQTEPRVTRASAYTAKASRARRRCAVTRTAWARVYFDLKEMRIVHALFSLKISSSWKKNRKNFLISNFIREIVRINMKMINL